MAGRSISSTTPIAKTFGNQDGLPSLPVPSLNETITRYLASCKPHLSYQDYAAAEHKILAFARSEEAQTIQKHLVNRSHDRRNWLEEWWQDLAYMDGRYPIYPLVNFGGLCPRFAEFPPRDGVQLQRASATAFGLLQFWDSIRKESLEIQRTRGNVLCMEQYLRLFATCRFPGITQDKLEFYFRTLKQEQIENIKGPRHIVVLYQGQYFVVDACDENDIVYPIERFFTAFQKIHKLAFAVKPDQTHVSVLGSLDRTEWCNAREHLVSLCAENRNLMEIIEKSIFIISMTEESPKSESDLARFAVAGNPKYMWPDKCMTFHTHKNGTSSSNCDHSPFDAIVTMHANNFIDQAFLHFLKEGKSMDLLEAHPIESECPKVTKLTFKIDSHLKSEIARANEFSRSFLDDLEVSTLKYHGFGKDFCRSVKLYGDTLVQLGIQLAYMRLHNQPAATYETGTTRQFFHGRTETVRSCTVESTELSKLILSGQANSSNKSELVAKFKSAYAKHNLLMDEAQSALGCDRHLLGLRQMAKELGMKEPEIFTDPIWTKSGGDGNFILSTSFVGYSNVYGGVAPMCADGYGTFYTIHPNCVNMFISTWKSSSITDIDLWKLNLTWALDKVLEISKMESAKL